MENDGNYERKKNLCPIWRERIKRRPPRFERMIISNTSPLIYLGKIKKLQILKKLFNEVTIPRQVYDEIIKGKEEKFLDALVIENAVKDSWIKVKDAEINEGAE